MSSKLDARAMSRASISSQPFIGTECQWVLRTLQGKNAHRIGIDNDLALCHFVRTGAAWVIERIYISNRSIASLRRAAWIEASLGRPSVLRKLMCQSE